MKLFTPGMFLDAKITFLFVIERYFLNQEDKPKDETIDTALTFFLSVAILKLAEDKENIRDHLEDVFEALAPVKSALICSRDERSWIEGKKCELKSNKAYFQLLEFLIKKGLTSQHEKIKHEGKSIRNPPRAHFTRKKVEVEPKKEVHKQEPKAIKPEPIKTNPARIVEGLRLSSLIEAYQTFSPDKVNPDKKSDQDAITYALSRFIAWAHLEKDFGRFLSEGNAKWAKGFMRGFENSTSLIHQAIILEGDSLLEAYKETLDPRTLTDGHLEKRVNAVKALLSLLKE